MTYNCQCAWWIRGSISFVKLHLPGARRALKRHAPNGLARLHSKHTDTCWILTGVPTRRCMFGSIWYIRPRGENTRCISQACNTCWQNSMQIQTYPSQEGGRSRHHQYQPCARTAARAVGLWVTLNNNNNTNKYHYYHYYHYYTPFSIYHLYDIVTLLYHIILHYIMCLLFSCEQRTKRSVSVVRPNSPWISPSAIGPVASIRHSRSENSAWSAWAWYTHILNPSSYYIMIVWWV